MKTNPILVFAAVAIASGIASTHACEDRVHADYGGQSCHEGWREYPDMRARDPIADCPDWHDETPGALGEHCPLVQAQPAPQAMPDWFDEAPRLPPTLAAPLPPIGIDHMTTQVDGETLSQSARD